MLYYITGNQNKKDIANKYLRTLNVSFETKDLDLIEIQSKSIEDVIIYKAKDAFNKLKKPLFVNDHFWSFKALGGFPGAYMKYMNQWLTTDDLLRLMYGKKDRAVTLKEAICYIDKNTTKIFLREYKGKVLLKKQGQGFPGLTVISLTKDGESIAKKLETDVIATDTEIWKEFAKWYKTYSKT